MLGLYLFSCPSAACQCLGWRACSTPLLSGKSALCGWLAHLHGTGWCGALLCSGPSSSSAGPQNTPITWSLWQEASVLRFKLSVLITYCLPRWTKGEIRPDEARRRNKSHLWTKVLVAFMSKCLCLCQSFHFDWWFCTYHPKDVTFHFPCFSILRLWFWGLGGACRGWRRDQLHPVGDIIGGTGLPLATARKSLPEPVATASILLFLLPLFVNGQLHLCGRGCSRETPHFGCISYYWSLAWHSSRKYMKVFVHFQEKHRQLHLMIDYS